MSAKELSRDHIPDAHLMRAVLDGHFLQWFCPDAMQWEPFATPTDALRALLLEDGTQIRLKPAVDTAIGSAGTDATAIADEHRRALTTPLAWWPQDGQTVYRADPEGPTGSEPLRWKATHQQRLYFERHLLYADEYSAMAAWRNKHQMRAPESNVIYCEFDKSLSAALATPASEGQPVGEPANAAAAM